MEKYKCPICGCKEYYELSVIGEYREERGMDERGCPIKTIITPRSFLIEQYTEGEYGSGDRCYSSHATMFLCKECGHIDFFNKKMADTITKELKQVNEEKQQLEKEIEKLEKELKNYQNEKDKLKAELVKIDELLSSEDITIRQQKELQEEKKKIEKNILPRINKIKSFEFPLEKQLKEKQKKLEDINKQINNIGCKIERQKR